MQHVYSMNCISEPCSFKHFTIEMFKPDVIPLLPNSSNAFPMTSARDACTPSQLSRVRLCNPVDCSPPGSSVPGMLHARILQWVAISSCRGSSQPRDQTRISRLLYWQAGLPLALPGKPPTGNNLILTFHLLIAHFKGNSDIYIWLYDYLYTTVEKHAFYTGAQVMNGCGMRSR
ncbi:unnamed protein product [Rangifer tarandus platyrhynchus]|uniref:Uncharacterized protein n=2 Tax=Rangifer tarandus platyrhynchus TaxID=3082113 RepID=A0ABN8YXS8_RANTA|nr:unnamed protein product [Rangifer tarandus platyrhynchus]